MSDFNIGFYEFRFTAHMKLLPHDTHVTLLQVGNRVVKKNFCFQIGRVAYQIGDTVKLGFQVLRSLCGYPPPFVVIVHIKIFGADILPFKLPVLYPVSAKYFRSMLRKAMLRD